MDALPVTDGRLERRRLGLFVLFAFGIAWATAGYIYANGGLMDSPAVFEAGPLSLTLSAVLLPRPPTCSRPVSPPSSRVRSPAKGGTTWDCRSGFRPLEEVRRRLVRTGLLTALGAALYFAVFPHYFDPTAESFASAAAGGADVGMSPLAFVAITVGAAMVINPLINAVFGFGEEFGWRAYLLPKLTPLGLRAAVVVQGLIWGRLALAAHRHGLRVQLRLRRLPVAGVSRVPRLRHRGGHVPRLAHPSGPAVSGRPRSVTAPSTPPLSSPSSSPGATPDYMLGPLPMGVVSVVPWLVLAGYLLSGWTTAQPRRGRRAASHPPDLPTSSSLDADRTAEVLRRYLRNAVGVEQVEVVGDGRFQFVEVRLLGLEFPERDVGHRDVQRFLGEFAKVGLVAQVAAPEVVLKKSQPSEPGRSASR